jgi:hypothetical protein
MLDKYKQTKKNLFQLTCLPEHQLRYLAGLLNGKSEYSAPAGPFDVRCSLESRFDYFRVISRAGLLQQCPCPSSYSPTVGRCNRPHSPFLSPRHPITGRPSKDGKEKFSNYAQLDFRLARTLETPQGHGSLIFLTHTYSDN